MSLIINKKIDMLKLGYPTVSDKYNVMGATLSGSSNVYFGDVVEWDTPTGEGQYVKAFAQADSHSIAGFVVATNVKTPTEYPAEEPIATRPGEALNLLVSGYIAVKLDSSAVVANIKPNTQVCLAAATGLATTVTTSNIAIDAYFTGVYEKHGSVYYAEIYVANPVKSA